MVLERLKHYIDTQGLTIAGFERSAGMSNASFGKALKTGKGIGTDKLENILTIYPDLSAEWLMRGEGGMLREVMHPHIHQTQRGNGQMAGRDIHNSSADAAELARLKEQVRGLELQLAAKEETIYGLRERIAELKERIEELKERIREMKG